jgi:hypothetical protein
MGRGRATCKGKFFCKLGTQKLTNIVMCSTSGDVLRITSGLAIFKFRAPYFIVGSICCDWQEQPRKRTEGKHGISLLEANVVLHRALMR